MKLFKKIYKKLPIKNYYIHKTAILHYKGNKKLFNIEKNAQIWEYVIIRINKYEINIGENCQIGPFCVIFGGTKISIKKNVMIAPHCVIAGGSHNHKQTKTSIREAPGFTNGPIIIEEGVWISSNCTILDNVTIGEGSVIGANSVVTKDIPPYSIACGSPAIIKKSRK